MNILSLLQMSLYDTIEMIVQIIIFEYENMMNLFSIFLPKNTLKLRSEKNTHFQIENVQISKKCTCILLCAMYPAVLIGGILLNAFGDGLNCVSASLSENL